MRAKRAAVRWISAVLFISAGACAPARWMSPEQGRAPEPTRVAVLGEVERPGWLTCPSRCDMAEAVDLVGGPTALARSVMLRHRQADGRWQTEWFRLDDVSRSRRGRRLVAGDIVVIGSTL